MGKRTIDAEIQEVHDTLKRKELELTRGLRRDGIAIETSADQMDQIQYASERDLAICSVDRDSALLREVTAALRRIDEDAFGTCAECGLPISARRLAAVPWARCCIECQQGDDEYRRGGSGSEYAASAG